MKRLLRFGVVSVHLPILILCRQYSFSVALTMSNITRLTSSTSFMLWAAIRVSTDLTRHLIRYVQRRG